MAKRIYEYFKSIKERLFSEDHPLLLKVGKGYARTSVNATIFRKSSIISWGDFQYISFYDKRGHIVIGKRGLGDKKFRLKRFRYKGRVTDAHNIISMGVDGEGFIHMAYGMHCAPLTYTRSKRPGSLRMCRIDKMDGKEESRVTYPEFYTMPGGDLLFVYRSGSSGNGNMVMKRYDVKERGWETVQANLLDGNGERNAYWQMYVDAKGVIHVSWVWRETPDVATNHDLCYARSLDGGKTWQKSDGTPYHLPIDEKNAEVIWHIPQDSELMNQTSMTSDEKGNVYIATYWRDADSDVPQYRIVWNKGKGWNATQAGKRETPFTLKGKGTKMVPVSRPVVLAGDQEVILIFRDKERGSKVTVGRISDIERGEWHFHDITDFSVEAWEPSYDPELWENKRILHLYVQTTFQGDGEKVSSQGAKGTPIWIWEASPRCDRS